MNSFALQLKICFEILKMRLKQLSVGFRTLFSAAWCIQFQTTATEQLNCCISFDHIFQILHECFPSEIQLSYRFL